MTARPGRPRADTETDWAMVDQLIAGLHPAGSNAAERRLAVGMLTAWGRSARFIALQLGVADRTVHHHRAKLRGAA